MRTIGATATATATATAVALAATLALATPPATVLAVGAPNPSAPAAEVKGGLAVLITRLTVVPKVQRTVHFTGYATYVFYAPSSRRIMSASARIVGTEAHAVAIRSRSLARDRKRYTVKLVFRGEQGNPGKLVVILGSVA